MQTIWKRLYPTETWESQVCFHYQFFFYFAFLIDIIVDIIYKSVLRHKNVRQWDCSILVTWYSDSVGYNRFQIGFVFVEYDLFYTTTFIQNCIQFSYHFDKVLCQFFETGTSDRYLICIVLYAWDSQVLSYIPCHFPLQFL